MEIGRRKFTRCCCCWCCLYFLSSSLYVSLSVNALAVSEGKGKITTSRKLLMIIIFPEINQRYNNNTYKKDRRWKYRSCTFVSIFFIIFLITRCCSRRRHRTISIVILTSIELILKLSNEHPIFFRYALWVVLKGKFQGKILNS